MWSSLTVAISCYQLPVDRGTRDGISEQRTLCARATDSGASSRGSFHHALRLGASDHGSIGPSRCISTINHSGTIYVTVTVTYSMYV